jgi:DNA polymerase
MAWTERQQAVLQAMGLRVWAPAAVAGLAGSDALTADADVDAPVEPSAPAERGTQPKVPAAAPSSTVSSPRPTEVAASGQPTGSLDWPALRDAVAACRACALCDSRRQTVFGAGHTQAHWLVIGEAPGEQEDRRGEPFVGPAGQLLDQMLAALGLTRDADGAVPAQQVYITNTLKCRPPDNRNPTPEELARCEPFLQRQIELLRPRIILAMGRFAVQALLRSSEAIGRLRGRVHHYQGVPLIVTYHPAYLLRNLPHKARAWEDLCLAADTLAALPPAGD